MNKNENTNKLLKVFQTFLTFFLLGETPLIQSLVFVFLHIVWSLCH